MAFVVVGKDWLKLSVDRALLASYNLEELWNTVIVIEWTLCLFFAVAQCLAALCTEYSDKPDWITCITHTLMFLLTYFDLVLQATVSYLLYGTDLCATSNVEYNWTNVVYWVVTLFLFLWVTCYRLYYYAMLNHFKECCTCKPSYKIRIIIADSCLTLYIVVTLISCANLFTSFYFECPLI